MTEQVMSAVQDAFCGAVCLEELLKAQPKLSNVRRMLHNAIEPRHPLFDGLEIDREWTTEEQGGITAFLADLKAVHALAEEAGIDVDVHCLLRFVVEGLENAISADGGTAQPGNATPTAMDGVPLKQDDLDLLEGVYDSLRAFLDLITLGVDDDEEIRRAAVLQMLHPVWKDFQTFYGRVADRTAWAVDEDAEGSSPSISPKQLRRLRRAEDMLTSLCELLGESDDPYKGPKPIIDEIHGIVAGLCEEFERTPQEA